jgi:hypothetical protein
VLDVSIEKLALSEMANARERLYRELETASANVRRLQALVRSHQIEFGEYASKLEAAGRIDEAQVLTRQAACWAAGSMPTCAPSIDDIQSALRRKHPHHVVTDASRQSVTGATADFR